LGIVGFSRLNQAVNRADCLGAGRGGSGGTDHQSACVTNRTPPQIRLGRRPYDKTSLTDGNNTYSPDLFHAGCLHLKASLGHPSGGVLVSFCRQSLLRGETRAKGSSVDFRDFKTPSPGSPQQSNLIGCAGLCPKILLINS